MQDALGIKHLHTLIIIVLLLFSVLMAFVVLLTNSAGSVLPSVVLRFVQFLFVVILLGIVLGVTSNFVYDKIAATLTDPNREAISRSGLDKYFLPDTTGERDRRTRDTVERIDALKGEVCLLGIAATSYLPKRDDATALSEPFTKKLLSADITLRIVLLNPYSEAAKFRYAREQGIDVDAVGGRGAQARRFEESAFYTEIMDTLACIKDLQNRGARIECRLTNFEPTISTMCTKDFTYVDILSLGRVEEAKKGKQRATFPILEFSPDSPYRRVARSHFEYHWRYAITPDELDSFKSEWEERFYRPSMTGYQLVKQHESWVSVDPVVGCTGGCKYCVLRTTFGNKTSPRLYTDPETIAERLGESKFYHPDAVLCLFNYSDALLQENQKHLMRCLRVLRESQFDNWVCLPTKQPFGKDVADQIIESYRKDRLIFLVSLSGMPHDHEPRVDAKALVATIHMLKALGVPVIHYWRPVTHVNSDRPAIESLLDVVSDCAESSVVVGLKASRSLNDYYLRDGLIEKAEMKDYGDYLPEGFIESLKKVINERHPAYPVYLHASCAVSRVAHQIDYNGTMFRKRICSLHPNGASLCPQDQKDRCELFRQWVEQEFDRGNCLSVIKAVLPGMRVRMKAYRVELLDPVQQDDLIYLIHRLKVPITAARVLYTNQYVGSILGYGAT